MTKPPGPFATMPQEHWYPGKGATLDHVIQLNCQKVVTQASCKTTRTWHDFNNQGTKMILLSDELWLIANNSRSFSNWSKPIIRNNLGLCKGCQNLPYLELLKTLSWIEWYKNIDLAMKDLSNKLMIFGGDRKKGRILSFSGKRLCL